MTDKVTVTGLYFDYAIMSLIVEKSEKEKPDRCSAYSQSVFILPMSDMVERFLVVPVRPIRITAWASYQ